MNKIEITPATDADLQAVAQIEEQASMQAYPNAKLGITKEDIAAIGWGNERLVKYRQRYLESPHAMMWIAWLIGKPVGFVAATKAEDQIIPKLYVAPDYQGQGIGDQLLAHAEAWLDTDKSIFVSVASYNEPALQFYQKHGYTPQGLRPEDQTRIPATGKVITEILLIKHPHS